MKPTVWLRLLLTIGLSVVTTAQTCHAQPARTGNSSQPLAAFSTGQAVRAYAAQFGAPDTPEYTRALRRAIKVATDQLATANGGYDPSRAIVLPDANPAVDNPQITLRVDSDNRYAAWLDKAADQPVIAFDLNNCSKADARVIGGTKIQDKRCFSDVALAYESSSKPFCSAVLILPRVMLTAAHCVCDTSMQFAVFGIVIDDPTNITIPIDHQQIYDGVRCKGSGVSEEAQARSLVGRDIALLFLEADVPPNVAQPSALPTTELATDLYASGNKNLVVVGFGYTELVPGNGDWLADNKRKTYGITAILSPDCTGMQSDQPDQDVYGCVAGKEILAKDDHPVGPCWGDSGGGAYMLVNRLNSNGNMAVLVGLNSRPILHYETKCGDGAIYTSLTPEIVRWIDTNIRDVAGTRH
jgi:hypothetical protein